MSNNVEVNSETSENRAVIDLMQSLHGVELLDTDAGHLAVIPHGMRIESLKPLLDGFRTAPERRSGTANIETLQSMVDHVNRFKDDDSALFATRDGGASITAVYDYHHRGHADALPNGGARFGSHRSKYSFPKSDAWAAWLARNGKSMDLTTFAEFLEDRIVDVLDPAEAGESTRKLVENLGITLAGASSLMNLSRGLTVKVAAKVAQHQKLSTGEGQIVFEQEHQDKDGAPLKVPGGFVIAIPVFEMGAAYQIPVRLRYRVRGGDLTWEFHLSRTTEVFDDAFTEACERVAAETDVPLFYGCPEG